jgi:hypothetical protein
MHFSLLCLQLLLMRHTMPIEGDCKDTNKYCHDWVKVSKATAFVGLAQLFD